MVSAVVALLRYRVTAVTVVTAFAAGYNSSAVTAAMKTRGTITTTTILVARGGREKANPV